LFHVRAKTLFLSSIVLRTAMLKADRLKAVVLNLAHGNKIVKSKNVA
jgi:hypothetical protein